jgi:hypothetical protein
MTTATPKKVRKPRKTSDRKRPNRKFILRMSEFRGFMSGTDKTLLTGLEVKNALARISTRGMSDDVTNHFTGVENAELQRLCKEFVKGVNTVLKGE